MTAEKELLEGLGQTQTEEGPSELAKATEALNLSKAKLAELEAHFEQCNRDAAAIKETDPARYALLTTIGKAIYADIEKEMIQKEKAEQAMMAAESSSTIH